jgi:hypothetical protein
MSKLLKYMKLGQQQAGIGKIAQGNILKSQQKLLAGGLERAGGLLSGGRYQAKAQAKDIATAQQGQAKASMLQRGLYNTTVYDTVSAGVSASLAGQLAEIDASYDSLLADFEMSGTQMQLGLLDKEAGLEQWYANAMMGSYSDMAGYIAGGNVTGGGFDMAGFGELWGSLGMGDALDGLFSGEKKAT